MKSKPRPTDRTTDKDKGTDDFTIVGGQTVRGHEEFRSFQGAILSLLPDLQVDVPQCISEGEDA